MNHKTLIKTLALILCFIGLAALLYFAFGLIEQTVGNTGSKIHSDDAFSYSEYAGKQIFYEGAWYTPRESLESFLIIGIDNQEVGTEHRRNAQQADFLALVVMDKAQEVYRILYLNRDTMADIAQTDAYGEEYGTMEAQLALAHAYGNEEKIRCRNTVNAVERLLYGINIDHYISLTMDAVPLLNDSVGGVTLQLMDDFTDLDEDFVKDAVVTLNGGQALTYVQARGALEDNSNLFRMERQRQYVAAFLEKAGSMEAEALLEAFLDAKRYIVSDCTADQFSRLAEKFEQYSYGGTDTPAGEAVKGTEYMEYHVDEQALQGLVVEWFYELRDQNQE